LIQVVNVIKDTIAFRMQQKVHKTTAQRVIIVH
jgi:hypothetical protein